MAVPTDLNREQGNPRLRVFIVDDSRVTRDRLISMLRQIDEVTIIGHAEDAFSAIDSIRTLAPDVVILDIHMPGSASGIYVLERIKSLRNVPVMIMLTNFSYRQYRKRCVEAGADFFFDKSTEFEKIPDVLRALASPPCNPFMANE